MNDMTKNIVLWLVIAGVLYVVASSINTQPTQQMLNYSTSSDMGTGRMCTLSTCSRPRMSGSGTVT